MVARAVGYEIYVRSFADSNGDGVGDLAGVTSRLDYLSWLGVDAVWLTPFYPSPGHDHGYDVSDYCAVSPHHGTLEDFDALVSEAHRRGLRVMVDIVPNHTSIEHEWFARARRDRDGPDRDRYLWADPAPDGGPPNNWRSHFGGPAWTLDEESGQYWCHLFLPEQPDRMSRYVAPGALDRAFFLRTAILDWAPEVLLPMVRAMHDAAPQGISWVLSNHDRSRVASRFGGGETGVRRSLAVTTLFMALGGTPFLYQGEELGLCDGVLRRGPYDPVSVRNSLARRVVGTGAGRPCPGTATPTTASPRTSRGSTPNPARRNKPSPASWPTAMLRCTGTAACSPRGAATPTCGRRRSTGSRPGNHSWPPCDEARWRWSPTWPTVALACGWARPDGRRCSPAVKAAVWTARPATRFPYLLSRPSCW